MRLIAAKQKTEIASVYHTVPRRLRCLCSLKLGFEASIVPALATANQSTADRFLVYVTEVVVIIGMIVIGIMVPRCLAAQAIRTRWLIKPLTGMPSFR